uniref:Uncharacterized protein n=1 Tax=Chenopodium quinoa TaxID=63459 RepID=A0A803MBH1_CHEQI
MSSTANSAAGVELRDLYALNIMATRIVSKMLQLGKCLKTIIHADYPEQWPDLLHWVKHNFQDQQVRRELIVAAGIAIDHCC